MNLQLNVQFFLCIFIGRLNFLFCIIFFAEMRDCFRGLKNCALIIDNVASDVKQKIDTVHKSSRKSFVEVFVAVEKQGKLYM